LENLTPNPWPSEEKGKEMKKENDYSKLPKWAQSEIDVLKKNIEHYKEQFRQMSEKDTNTFMTRGLRDNDVGLPRDSSIRFVFGLRKEIDVRIDMDNNLYVSGLDTLQIIPWASNVVKIRILKD
jgi:hypothetical protein